MGIIVGFALCFQRIKDKNLTLDSHLFSPLFLRRTHVKSCPAGHPPQGLQGGLSKLWIVDLLQWDEQTRQICIDGKTMRGVKKLSPDTESHIVSAYDPHLQLVLSMDAVPVKGNELDAIRRLLNELDVTDALITIDAIGCQHDVAAQVLEAGGDYVLQVKGNQPTLLQELEDSFPNISKGYTVNKEEGLEHGRIEHRQMKSVVLSPEMLG